MNSIITILRKGYIEIKADRFLNLYGKLTGTKGIKAGAFYPFIFTTDAMDPLLKKYFINHKLIHFVPRAF